MDRRHRTEARVDGFGGAHGECPVVDIVGADEADRVLAAGAECLRVPFHPTGELELDAETVLCAGFRRRMGRRAAETVGTGLGPMPTIHLSARRPAGRVEETMDIWLGAKTRWLPVRIRIVDRNGSVIDSVLQTASIH